MGAGASTDLSKDQLKEKYADVKHRLYPAQQADVEAKFAATENPAEILECVNGHLNNPEVPNLDLDEKPEFTDKHISLMAKHLTPELFAELKAAGATSKGYTISRAVQTGLMTPHLGVGITAGDEESWELFKKIYYPIINGWHKFDPETQNHTSDLDASKLTMTDEQVRCTCVFRWPDVCCWVLVGPSEKLILVVHTDEWLLSGSREPVCLDFLTIRRSLLQINFRSEIVPCVTSTWDS